MGDIVMSEEIVSFEVAKLAKEKGFKEFTHSYYFEDGEFREHTLTGTNGYYGDEYEYSLEEFYENWNDDFLTKKNGGRCFGCSGPNYLKTYSAPTQSLLLRWLRENKSIHIKYIYMFDESENKHCFRVVTDDLDKDYESEIYSTYELGLDDKLKEALSLVPNVD